MNSIIPTCAPRFGLIIGLLGIFLAIGEAHGQRKIEYSEPAERSFKEGMSLFVERQFEEAVRRFERVSSMPGVNQRTTAALIMNAKTLYRLYENLQAEEVLTGFLQRFPASSYVADAHYTLGLIRVRLHNYENAVDAFLHAWRAVKQGTANAKLTQDIIASMEGVIENQIPVVSVRAFASAGIDADERAFFWFAAAGKELRSGRIAQASAVVDTLATYYATTRWGSKVADLRVQVERRSSVKLGALLPLMRSSEPSALREIGNEVYDGVRYALEEYGHEPSASVKVSLELRDTERDPLVASRHIQELSADEDVIGILGPVFSNTTSAVVGVANLRGVPLVTPTANANGIAAAGPYIFQANPDYETRGRAMARYAVNARGFQTLAVLAPIDTYAKFMAEAFIDEANRLGAHIIGTEWYERGSSDLSLQLGRIREAGMLAESDPTLAFGAKARPAELAKLVQLGVSPKTIDSLLAKAAEVRSSALLGPGAKQKLDSVGLNSLYAPSRIDSLQYPVLTIDGFYVPISSPDEIGVISSQLVYFNFKTQLLGSGEWSNFAELDANKRYCNGAIFESDSYLESNDPSYVKFADSFIAATKKRPTKNTFYGYDVAKLVLSLINSGGTSRENLRRALERVQDYRGLHSTMGFSRRRVNPWVSILQYSADQIRRLEEINTDERTGGYRYEGGK